MKNVTIDRIEYQPIKQDGEKLMIVVVDNRGLTFVGRCDLSGDQEAIVIRDAKCIIRWGTSGHLAELVHGPTSNTILGKAHDVTVFRIGLILAYECNEEGWK